MSWVEMTDLARPQRNVLGKSIPVIGYSLAHGVNQRGVLVEREGSRHSGQNLDG